MRLYCRRKNCPCAWSFAREGRFSSSHSSLCACSGIFTRQESGLDVGVPAAICAAETLEGYEFDGAERLSDGRWRLYRREPGAMGTRRVTVAVLRLPEGAATVAEHFRDMRSLRGGVFFATDLSWDTEWSGVYVAASIDEDLRPYCAAELGEGAWYLAFLPFGFA